MLQLLLSTESANEGRILLYVLIRSIHGGVKVCLDLEELFEVHVKKVELLVKQRISNQDDLNVQRDRVRSQSFGSDESHTFPRLLNDNAFIHQGSLQGVIGEEVAKQLLYREH